MTATVTLEPRLKLTFGVACLQPGAPNTARREGLAAACRGYDASVALRARGLPTICLGISYARDADLLEGFLETQCIARDFAVSPGSAGRDIVLNDAIKAETTTVSIPADPVPPAVIEEYLKKLRHHAHHCTEFAFCDGFHLTDIIRRSLEVLEPLGFGVVPGPTGGPIIAKKDIEEEKL
jgi:fructose-1-phosphate kinase PfkB-like protein